MSSLKTSLIIWALLVAISAIAFSPALRHALDHGAETVSIDRLLAGDWPSTRNIAVRGGRLATDARLLDADQPLDLFIWSAVVGMAFVFGGIFTLASWIKQRRQS
ncbi:MAG TPA: hypothetical protein VFF06_00550 [Polyangia bacterium]|nr:hypothetical protein [Polyangia bacterium]